MTVSQRVAQKRPDLPDFHVPLHDHTSPRTGGALVSSTFGGGSGGGGGGTPPGSVFEVTDGVTTVNPASVVDFTSGATVTDLGGGVAGVAVTGGLSSVTDGTTTVSPVTSATVPLGGVTDLGGGDARLNFVPQRGGGPEFCDTDAAVGATKTLDWSAANAFDLTLTTGCTISFSNVPAVAGTESSITVFLRGSFATVWPGALTWLNGVAPTGATLQVVTITTTDGGTTFGGVLIGAGSVTFATPAIVLGTAAAAGAASTVIRSDSTIVAFDTTVPVTQAFGDAAATGSAAVAARRDHVHGMPANPTSGPIWRPVMASDGTSWHVVTSSDGNAIMVLG